MQRLLVSLVAAPLLTVAATAQGACFEQNFGILAPLTGGAAGYGDDVQFDLAPLCFNFPMGGLATTYSHASINGVVPLRSCACGGQEETRVSGGWDDQRIVGGVRRCG